MKKIFLNNLGFTLVELLISVSIIAILTAVAAVAFGKAQGSAQDMRRIQDIDMLKKAATEYYAFEMQYPKTFGPWNLPSGNGQTILPVFPSDPKASASIGWSNYDSLSTLPGDSFCFCAQVEDNKRGNTNMSKCVDPIGIGGSFYCVKN
jgi:prepilin-type N-terminal cleavage/methylation domain-containing protein